MYENDRAKKFHYVKLIPSRFKLNHCVKRDKYASTTKLVFFGNVPEKTTKQQLGNISNFHIRHCHVLFAQCLLGSMILSNEKGKKAYGQGEIIFFHFSLLKSTEKKSLNQILALMKFVYLY